MARRARRSAKRRWRAEPAPSGASRPLVNALAPLALLTQDDVARIHEAALKLLAEVGVVFRSQAARAVLKQGGAHVSGERVTFDADLIAACLASAPATYTLHARNPANTVTVGGDNIVVMPGGGSPFVHDLDGRRRPGTLADLANFTRLSALSPVVHVVGRKAVEAQDVPVPIRHLICWHTALTLADKPVQSGFVGGRAEAEDALAMLAIVFGGEAAIDGLPVAHCSVNANSPLLYDEPMLASLMAFARVGQPVLVSPFVMAGVTGPTTLAGALAQHNAEVLAGLALAQMVRPGTPVLYGTATSNVDLRNANPAIGSPESAISIAACAQLARFYNLPCRGGGALTDSPLPDAQSNFERMFTLLTSVLSGVDYLMHGLGILESYLTLSYEQFVIDLELLEMVRHFLAPVVVDEETLALDAIARIGPGGHFLGAAHTMRHYRRAHYLPAIALRQPYDQWTAAGGVDAGDRARERCRALLAAYERPAMETAVADALRAFVERRVGDLLPAGPGFDEWAR